MLALQSLMLRPQYQLVKSTFLILTIEKSYRRETLVIATCRFCRGKDPITERSTPRIVIIP